MKFEIYKFKNMKFLILILIIIITPIISGFYGIFNDQFSYSISPEYFTKFKFYQFNIAPAIPYRLGVLAIGWSASWWVGIPLGVIIGIVGLIHKNWKDMLRISLKSIVFIIVITIIFGISGLLFGKFFLQDQELQWFFPNDLVDRKHFIMVGSMHNFSYIGAIVGLIFGILYQIRIKKKLRYQMLVNEIKQ